MPASDITTAPEGVYARTVHLREREYNLAGISNSFAPLILLPSVVMGGLGVFNTIATVGTGASSYFNMQGRRWHGHVLTPRQSETNLRLARNSTSTQMLTAATLVPSNIADIVALRAAQQRFADQNAAIGGLTAAGMIYLGMTSFILTANALCAGVRRSNIKKAEAALLKR